MKNIIVGGLIVSFVAIQFVKPEKNTQEGISSNEISVLYDIPTEVQNILENSCYDCHSNNTNYPAYYAVQPFAWWISHHIEEAQNELNFSEFATYDLKKQAHKLEEIAEEVEEKEMPLESYLITHKEAQLSNEQRELIEHWATGLKDQIDADIETQIEVQNNDELNDQDH
jgi:hypothetical protein